MSYVFAVVLIVSLLIFAGVQIVGLVKIIKARKRRCKIDKSSKIVDVSSNNDVDVK